MINASATVFVSIIFIYDAAIIVIIDGGWSIVDNRTAIIVATVVVVMVGGTRRDVWNVIIFVFSLLLNRGALIFIRLVMGRVLIIILRFLINYVNPVHLNVDRGHFSASF